MARIRLPIFHKALNIIRVSVLNIHKLRKPIIPKLLLLKKLRKRKEFKLLWDSNNHGFLGEYQFSFSPSSTPLIHYYYHRNQFKNRGYREYLCSFLYLYWCLGNLKVEGGEECQLEALSSSVAAIEDANDVIGEDMLEGFDSSGDEGESVDQRAERFIERFYQEMRMQRQQSI